MVQADPFANEAARLEEMEAQVFWAQDEKMRLHYDESKNFGERLIEQKKALAVENHNQVQDYLNKVQKVRK